MYQFTYPQVNRLSSVWAYRHGKRAGHHRLKPCICLIILLVCAFGLVGGGPALAQTKMVYSDTEFDDKSWSDPFLFVTPEGAPNAAFDHQQAGDQDPYLELTLTRATVTEGGTGTWAALINRTMVWDPSEDQQGPIGKIDLQVDIVRGGAWSLAVKQDGYVWLALAKRAIMTTLDPFHVSIDCLEENDFVALPGSEFIVQDQPLHPDFSADGGPISFGISLGLSCPSHVDCTAIRANVFEVDNFQVTVRSPFHINSGLNDAWFDPLTDGQGFLTAVFPKIELVFVSWFTYDTTRPPDDVTAMLGEPGHRWLTAQGGYRNDVANLEIVLTEGGVFDKGEPSPSPGEVIGTMTIEWCDCEKGWLTYNMPELELIGNIKIQRITHDNVALCEALLE